MFQRRVNRSLRISCLILIASLIIGACNLPAAIHNVDMPGQPSFTNYTPDCQTTGLTAPLQPLENCDRWQDNRYERPFNAVEQNTYYPDLDILFSALGESENWVFARIVLAGFEPSTQTLTGSYAIEIDTDEDQRGDFLIVDTPGSQSSRVWNSAGLQIWQDSNNDVGNQVPGRPDGPYAGNGYDELLSGGSSLSKTGYFARVGQENSRAYIEFAIDRKIIGTPDSFSWWTWADAGLRQWGQFDYHDTYDRATAGTVYKDNPDFPAKAIARVDNTCADTFNGKSPQVDTHFCLSDPSITYVPPSEPCEDPVLVGASIVCNPPAMETPTVTPTCQTSAGPISIHTPTPGGPSPCSNPPPCVTITIGKNTPDPGDRCTPTAQATMTPRYVTATARPTRKPRPTPKSTQIYVP